MQNSPDKDLLKIILKVSRFIVYMGWLAVVGMVILIFTLVDNAPAIPANPVVAENPAASKPIATPFNERSIPADAWKAPDINSTPQGKNKNLIVYGKALLAHTADYLGPKGSVAHITNGMNCQNCHLEGGTRLFGNNYASFIASYPKMSFRSGRVEPATERIAECFERSLAGAVPDTNGHEVQAILAYMKWLGKDVKKGQKLFGNATEKLPFMTEAANPAKGKTIYALKCQSCHGKNGEGLFAADKKSYTYPPLWGAHSYNDGAGMYRLGNFAGFVKNNMPFGASYLSPQLSDHEAWDVAAFVNSQPRPHREQHNDWKDMKSKPIDYPFGPYADKFSEKQHKFGPFKPIKDAQKELITKKL